MSFAVDIDEGSVQRLKAVLEDNRDLANELSAAFQAATEAISQFIAVAQAGGLPNGTEGSGSSGEADSIGVSDNTESHTASSAEEAADRGSPAVSGKKQITDKDGNVRGTVQRNETQPDPVQSLKNLARMGLGGVMTDEDLAVPTTMEEWALRNLETMTIGQATKDSANARKELVSWREMGFASDPNLIPGYAELQEKASEMLRQPIAQARQYMQQAMDADAAGLDATEYLQSMREVLFPSMQEVKKMYNEFFASGGETGAEDGSGSKQEAGLDTKKAGQDVEKLRKEAAKPVSLTADASGIASAGQNAYSALKAMFASPITVGVKFGISGEGGSGTGTGSGGSSGAGTGSGTNTGGSSGTSPIFNIDTSLLYGGIVGTSIPQKSTGGKFSNPSLIQVAEDGDDEYVIPVKKTSLAVPLIRQMFEELSPDAQMAFAQGIRESNGRGLAGNGQDLMRDSMVVGLASASQVIQNNQLSAPVTIHVDAEGQEAELVGQSIYRTAEAYLMRTMRSVFG